jgi:hypothetical protein
MGGCKLRSGVYWQWGVRAKKKKGLKQGVQVLQHSLVKIMPPHFVV